MTEIEFDAVLLNPDGTEDQRRRVETVNGAPPKTLTFTTYTDHGPEISEWFKDDDTSIPPADVRYRWGGTAV